MARSAKDSFELANRVLREARGSKTSSKAGRVLHVKARKSKAANKLGTSQRAHAARELSNRAQESNEAHSHHLGMSKKFASDAAENLREGRERQRKRAAANLKPSPSKKRTG